jgi:hypothetical protein
VSRLWFGAGSPDRRIIRPAGDQQAVKRLSHAPAAAHRLFYLSPHSPDTDGFTDIVALLTGFGNGKPPSRRAKGDRTPRPSHSRAAPRPICNLLRPIPRPDYRMHVPSADHAGAGGSHRRMISDRMSPNICGDIATSVISKIT